MARACYRKTCRLVVLIQTVRRGRIARRRYERMRLRRRAAVVIQAAFRMWCERSRFLRQRQVAVVVQRMFRRLVRGGR
jgi:hypothetical protein